MLTNKIYNEDCLKGMKKIPNDTIDLIITDPPFNIGKKYNSPFKDKLNKEDYIAWCKQWLLECVRILKKNGSLYLFNYPENNAYLLPFLEEHLLFKRWITWHYPTNTGHSNYNYTRTQHSILFFSKGKKQKDCIFNKNAIAEPYKNPTDRRIKERIKNGSKGKTPYDVFKYQFNGEDLIELNIVKNVNKDKTQHVCQLPISLLDVFVKASSNKNDIILDPFSGSGSVLYSAIKNNRRFIGFEISKKYVELSEKRLKNQLKIDIQLKFDTMKQK